MSVQAHFRYELTASIVECSGVLDTIRGDKMTLSLSALDLTTDLMRTPFPLPPLTSRIHHPR